MFTEKGSKLGLVWGARLLAIKAGETSNLKTGLEKFFRPDLRQPQVVPPIPVSTIEDMKKQLDPLFEQQSEAVFFRIANPDLSLAVGREPSGPADF